MPLEATFLFRQLPFNLARILIQCEIVLTCPLVIPLQM